MNVVVLGFAHGGFAIFPETGDAFVGGQRWRMDISGVPDDMTISALGRALTEARGRSPIGELGLKLELRLQADGNRAAHIVTTWAEFLTGVWERPVEEATCSRAAAA